MIRDIPHFLLSLSVQKQLLMKKIIVSLISAAAVLVIAGCAKQAVIGPNDANKRYFDAWMQLNHPDAQPVGFGIYILEDEPGTGVEVKKDGYVRLDYVTTSLEGNISAYTDAETAKQLGTYNETYYYGPKFMTTAEGTVPAGLWNALEGMKTGGHRKVIIPSWLMSYKVYETAQEYIDTESDTETTIYDFTVRDFTTDIIEWEAGEIGKYFAQHTDVFGNMTAADSLKGYKGFYYKTITPPTDTVSFKKDSTIYINYTGKLLDGTVFDTTIERLAKDSGIWSSTRDYAPVSIKWGEKYTDITMGSSGSSVISGFALTLWQMRKLEKGVGVFTSGYGYGVSGSGENIPPYAPLVFEIEIVPKPEE